MPVKTNNGSGSNGIKNHRQTAAKSADSSKQESRTSASNRAVGTNKSRTQKTGSSQTRTSKARTNQQSSRSRTRGSQARKGKAKTSKSSTSQARISKAKVAKPGTGQTRVSQVRASKGKNIINRNGTLKLIPLGGMREIGKNITVIEYDNQMIIVDCGLGFPEEDMPGIDIVIPDFSYLEKNKHKLKAAFLTHGHEDHIGALPWLCKQFNIPIYGNKLTIELVRLKLSDRVSGVSNAQLIAVNDGDIIETGLFCVEFIHVNHSIADANALAIRTPIGTIFHTGDFKIDYTPIHGGPADLSRIAQIGSEGVLLMMSDSTNAEREGYTPSESKIGESFADLFARAHGKIFVATFSSNVFRLQQILTAAEMYDRKVALLGRSMLNVFKAADSLGYIKVQPGTMIELHETDRYDNDRLLFITTGSQGEPMSALTRMAFSEHRRVEIEAGDMVILSSSAIPGNEKPIHRVIDELFKQGAEVIYESLNEIHVSGHAYREELKLMQQLIKPKYFIPTHGEYRHLYKHAELAHSMGMAYENIFLLNNGDIFEYSHGRAKISGFTNAGGILIDGSGTGDVDSLVLRDRLLLADDGLVAVNIAIDTKTGKIIGVPELQAKGFIYEREVDKILEECRRKIIQFANRAHQRNKPLAAMIRSGALKDQLRDLLFERTRRRPMIIVSVIEI